MFNLDWFNQKRHNNNDVDLILKENEVLKKQLKELIALDETGFFIELDLLLNAILKKVLILYKTNSSFIALTSSKEPSEFDVHITNLIEEDKMNKIKEAYKKEYSSWKETEADIINIDDFILLPLVRRHKILGIIGLKSNQESIPNTNEILSVLSRKAAASLESAILYERMFKRLLVLSNVFILGREIVTAIDIESLLDKFLKIAIDGTNSDIAAIYLFRDKVTLPYFSRLMSHSEENIKFSSDSCLGYTELIKDIRAKGTNKIINNFDGSEFKDSEINKIDGIVIKDTFVSPLKTRDSLLGVIQLCNKFNGSEYTNEDIEFLNILSSQLAFVIQNTELFNNLEKAYLDTLSALTNAIDAKDSYTRGHSDRVTDLSVKLAKEAGVNHIDIERIRLGGMLHDIGKIGIPELILNKPGRLDNNEFEVIKSHPVLGVSILGNVEFLQNVVPIIKHHHERYDGKGYPDKLKGNDIPYLARIVSIADTFDAMTTNRPYRKGLSVEESLSEIERCKETQFDPELADLFINMVRRGGHQ